MRSAVLSGAMRFPVETIDVEAFKSMATYRYRPMSLGDDEPDIEVEAWYLDGDFLCMPRQLGISLCNQLHLDYVDETSEGSPAIFPKLPTLRDHQEGPVQEIVDTFDSAYDFIFRAHTGWGKTVGSIYAAAEFGRTTLVVVDQDNLKDQWVEALVKHYGFKESEIGSIQGPVSKWRWRGHSVVIAMVQSLSQKGVDDELRDYFGFVIFDEVHTVGAITFSRSLSMFSATRRLGVSATPKRRDGLQKSLDQGLGKVRVSVSKKHDRSAVYVIRNHSVYSFYANVSKMTGRIFSELEEDGPRNLTLAEAAVWLYETGRDVLVLSDRIEQLKELSCLVYYLGIPEEAIGLYTGFDPLWVFTKDKSPSGRPEGLHKWKGDDGKLRMAPYSAVTFQAVRKRIPKARLAEIKANCSVVFATYQMFAKGMDMPNLTGGLDATPRGTAEQIHGRILRGEEGRPVPIWVTIADVNSYRLMYQFANRVTEYTKSNGVMFEWHEDGSVEQCDAKTMRREAFDRSEELRSMQIRTNSDGLNMLVTPADAKKRKQTAANDIVSRCKAVAASRSRRR